jgi:putative hydrolase of the HAD superfamily
MTIKAVFFDMGGTLQTFTYDRQLRLNATPGLQELLERAGIDLHLENEQLYELVEKGFVRYHAWRMESLDELSSYHVWKEFILKGYDVSSSKLRSIAEDLTLYYETHFYTRTLRPEVPQVLAKLKSMGLKIGLISNVISHGQVPLNLTEYGIKEYFKPVVLSSEYGRRKPDPAIFHYAARLAKVPTSESIYVGDRIARDVLGAKRAGFRLAIQIVHDFEYGEADEGAKPDAVIHSLAELIGIVQKENDGSKNPHGGMKEKTTTIRAFLFDAGDILYHRPNKGEKFVAFLAERGLSESAGNPGKRRRLQTAAYKGEVTRDEYHEAILRSYGLTRDEDICLGKKAISEDDNNIHVFDGVPGTLRKLKDQGFYLGIITDTSVPISTKLSWFEKAGFGNVWDSVVSSQEVGLKKPHPKIYQVALDQLGVKAQEAVFVGHLPAELKGAALLGIHTVAFNKDAGARSDGEIKEFHDLLDLPCIHQNR